MKKTYIILIFISLILANCTSSSTCIEGDDFGYNVITVPSRPNTIKSIENTEYVDWLDTGLEIDGTAIQFAVAYAGAAPTMSNTGTTTPPASNSINFSNTWAPWYCGGTVDVHDCSDNAAVPQIMFENLCSTEITNLNIDKSLYTHTDSINLVSDTSSSFSSPAKLSSSTDDQAIQVIPNTGPCLMGNGLGLYGLVIPKGDSRNPNDPNNPMYNVAASIQTYQGNESKNTPWLTFHMGQNYGYSGGISYGEHTGLGGITLKNGLGNYVSGRLYFKIIDQYYSDNTGSYSVIIKSGASNNSKGPLNLVNNYISDILIGSSKLVYQIITADNGFHRIVVICLSLYIVFWALGFLIGIVEISQKDLMTRIVKFGLVIGLINSEYSASFFNNYLVEFFIKGLQQMMDIASGSNVDDYFSFIDSSWNLLFSNQVLAKILGMPFAIILVALLFVYASILIMCLASLYVGIFYIMSIITLSFILAFAPIFFVFLLFRFTEDLFNNWIKLLASNFLQALMVVAGFIFVYQIYFGYMYKILGYRVCPTPVSLLGYNITNYWNISVNNEKGLVQIPFSSAKADQCSLNSNNQEECNSYKIEPPFYSFTDRYYTLPTIDPILDYNIYKTNSSPWEHKGQIIINCFNLMIIAYVIMRCLFFIPKFASYISGTQYNWSSVSHMSDAVISNAYSALRAFGVTKKVDDLLEKKIPGLISDKFYKRFNTLGNIGKAPFKALSKSAKDNLIKRPSNAIGSMLNPGKNAEINSERVGNIYGKYTKFVEQRIYDVAKKFTSDDKRIRSWGGENHDENLNKKILNKRLELIQKLKKQHEDNPNAQDMIDEGLKKYDAAIEKRFNKKVEYLLRDKK